MRGEYLERDWKTQLRIAWGSKTPKEREKLRKMDAYLIQAIEGILKYD